MKQIEPHDHHLFYEHEAQRDRAIEKQESEADYAIDKLIRDGKLIETLAGLSPHDGKGISANTKPKNRKEQNTMNTKTTTDERILNASAKAIGPCHLPGKREMSAADKSAHTPLIASQKVDKWLDELRQILVDRSEFKLADHVVSARVVIRMLEKQRSDLLEALKDLRARVVAEKVDCLNTTKADAAIAKAEGSAQ